MESENRKSQIPNRTSATYRSKWEKVAVALCRSSVWVAENLKVMFFDLKLGRWVSTRSRNFTNLLRETTDCAPPSRETVNAFSLSWPRPGASGTMAGGGRPASEAFCER